MTKKDQKTLWIVAAIFIVLYLISKKSTGKNISVTMDFILGGYTDLVNNKANLTFEGLPLHIYLARNTTDYDEIKEDYFQLYNRNLTFDIIGRLTPEQLSEFVAELWKNNEQAIS